MNKLNLLLLLFVFLKTPSVFGQTTVFSDDFETPQTWTIFEEIVSGNACYGSNIGEVARSTDVAQTGTNALRVWSVTAGSNSCSGFTLFTTASTLPAELIDFQGVAKEKNNRLT